MYGLGCLKQNVLDPDLVKLRDLSAAVHDWR